MSDLGEAGSGREQKKYKYIYPPNARHQEQLDIMLRMEAEDRDPMALENIDQENQRILFQTEYWHVSENRYPRPGSETSFLIVALGPVYEIEEISPEMWLDLQQIWQKLVREYKITGGGICMRFGDPVKSGASLTRLHVHVIMPKDGEKVRFPIGGQAELEEGLHL